MSPTNHWISTHQNSFLIKGLRTYDPKMWHLDFFCSKGLSPELRRAERTDIFLLNKFLAPKSKKIKLFFLRH